MTMWQKLSLGLLSIFAMGTMTMATTVPVAAACNDSMFGINAWYRGLVDGSCNVKPPSKDDDKAVQKFVWTIVLNLLQAGLALAAYVTIFFLIKGGFVYILAAGSQDKMAEAKNTIKNALIGLVIAVFSASIVNAIAGIIK
jgi:hypothetical protein